MNARDVLADHYRRVLAMHAHRPPPAVRRMLADLEAGRAVDVQGAMLRRLGVAVRYPAVLYRVMPDGKVVLTSKANATEAAEFRRWWRATGEDV